jgi:hypothetical protein
MPDSNSQGLRLLQSAAHRLGDLGPLFDETHSVGPLPHAEEEQTPEVPET